MSLIQKFGTNNNVDSVPAHINQVESINTYIGQNCSIGQNSNMNGKHDGKKNLLKILAKIKSAELLIQEL